MFLTRKILKYKYYKHNYFGLLILILGVIINMLVDALYLGEIRTEIEKYEIMLVANVEFTLISQTITAFQEVGEKYLMDKRYIDPLLLLSFEGFFGTLLLGLFVLFFQKSIV